MVSLLGTWMQRIGQSWLVLQLTHSAVQLGVVGALQFLPLLLFSLLGGVFADRWPKRRVLFVTQTAAMVQALLLWALFVTGTIQLWQIYILAPLLGLTDSLDQPARSAFVLELVGREDLPNAVALNSSMANLARVVGPGFGGVIIAASGVGALFLLNGLSFLAVIVALALMRSGELHAPATRPVVAGERQSTWESLREGLNYVRGMPAAAMVIAVVGLVLLFGANFDVVLPLFASGVLRVGPTGFGLLFAAMDVGALLGGLWLAWSHRAPTICGILIGTLAFGSLEALFALSHVYALSLALIAGVGVTEAIFGTQAITALQTLAPDHLRGRVVSVYVFFFTGSIPVGYLLAGWLSARLGPSLGLLLCALICVTIAASGWLWRTSAERGLEAPADPRPAGATGETAGS
jgi:MFS family permease